MTAQKKPTHYIDNDKLFEELVKHKKACRKARKEGEQDPILNTYIGESIVLLARKIGTQSCFSSYSYLDEMISDGVENVLMYGIHNFDPKKRSDRTGKTINIFAYFTQIITWAFIRRIQKEKKQQYIKLMNMRHHHVHESLNDNRYVVSGDKEADEFIQKFEESVAKKKQKRAPNDVPSKAKRKK